MQSLLFSKILYIDILKCFIYTDRKHLFYLRTTGDKINFSARQPIRFHDEFIPTRFPDFQLTKINGLVSDLKKISADLKSVMSFCFAF